MASKKKMKRPNKICAAGIAWAKRTFDTYPSAYANMLISVDSVTAIEVYAPLVPAVPTLLTPAVYSVPGVGSALGPSLSSAENLSG